ncbi:MULTISPECIES: helix-turn-helix transcriptional regulator [Bacillus cereus group]|uniref:helix-turn-helix domain-containing protein n=1 Tax=Bacillus cereus group TaxID=86661 RepID=UPI0021C20824|nr:MULTISPECIES: helix-turn-helix transcriptional regulator [Bacillus cereus group]MDA2194783.1 helix-turn-helix transcriptional regulator [Bacillus cereus group sp. Bc238]MDA2200436.1 helix-turn-helix transcriptional regulator [Bacillus cereus group sp. Bc237]
MLKILKSIKSWKLREFRQSKSLTIPQFSNELNYNPTLIGMYERGIKRPDSSFWDKLNNTYNMSPDYFMQ